MLSEIRNINIWHKEYAVKLTVLAFMLAFFFSGCEEKRDFKKEMKDMSWIQGTWVSEDLEYAEKWQYGDYHYTGYGYKISGYDTIPQEEMLIILDKDKILFLTKNVENYEGKFLAYAYKPEYSDLLIFENEQMEYPRRIIYRRMPFDEMRIRFEGAGGENPKAFNMKKKSS